MSYGGRGRGGWGRGQWSGRRGPSGQVRAGTFDLFPKLPALPVVRGVLPEEEKVLRRKWKLENFWKYSPYYLEKEALSSNGKVAEIERYSARRKQRIQAKRLPLSTYLKLTPSYFPMELLHGSRHVQSTKAQWAPQPDLRKLDLFEKLEQERQKNKGQDEKSAERKKEDEDEDAEEEEIEQEEEELIGDGDYNQIYGFDDDDDYIEEDGGCEDDEKVY